MKKILMPMLLAVGLLGWQTTLTPANAAGLTMNITGNVWGAQGPGNFNGTITLNQAALGNGLMMVGVLNGTAIVNSGVGSTQIPINNVPFAVPVTLTPALSGNNADPVCQVLTLNIGAIHLDLLGLIVDLNPIMLNVTANSAEGLLGSLLCSLSGLLSSSGPLGTLIGDLTTLLNDLTQINSILAGL